MAGRPLTIVWNETADELLERHRTELDPRRRTRLRALWLLRQGYSIEDTSEMVDASYRTIQRWIGWYRLGGVDAVLKRVPGHGASGRHARLNREQEAAIAARAMSGGFRTVWDAIVWVREQWGVTYTYTGMHALMQRQIMRSMRAKSAPLPASPALVHSGPAN
jgi:transposase